MSKEGVEGPAYKRLELGTRKETLDVSLYFLCVFAPAMLPCETKPFTGRLS